MKILFLSQYFMPEPGATSELLSGIALGLAKDATFEVKALAGQPSYFGAARVASVINVECVEVRRIASTQLNKNAAMGRVLNSATFALSALWTLVTLYRKFVVIAVTNPPLLMWVCYAANRMFGIKYVVLIHDVYPDIAVELGVLPRNGPITNLWRWLNRRAYRCSERVIVLGRDMRTVVQQEIPEYHAKISIIANWADKDSIRPRSRDEHPKLDDLGIRDRFIVLYSGNIGRFHEIETILDAAHRLDDGRFVFVFYGEGKQAGLVRQAQETSLHHTVRLLPFQPRERLGLTLTGCDASLVTLRAGLTGLAVPSKLYGALASGKPVVAVAPEDCEAALLIRDYDCGVVSPPGDGEALANELLRLRGDRTRCAYYGQRARAVFEQRFDVQTITDEWRTLMLGLHTRRR